MQKAGGSVTRGFGYDAPLLRQSSPEWAQAPSTSQHWSAESPGDPEVGNEKRPAKAQLKQQANFLFD